MLFLLSSSSSSLLLLLSSSSSFYYYYYYYSHYHYYYYYYYYYYYCHYSVNNIPYQCDITCAGHFTLDALASRTVACCLMLLKFISHTMMKSSNGNIFRVTGLLCGEFSSHRWILAQRPVKRNFDVFFDLRLNQQLSKQWKRRWKPL